MVEEGGIIETPRPEMSANLNQKTTDYKAVIIGLIPHSQVIGELAAGNIATAREQATVAAKNLVKEGWDPYAVKALRVTLAAAIAAEDKRDFADHLVGGEIFAQDILSADTDTSMRIVEAANRRLIRRSGMSPDSTKYIRELIAAGLAGSNQKAEIVSHLTSEVKGLENFSDADTDQLKLETQKAIKAMLNRGISPEQAKDLRVMIAASIVGSQ